MSAKEAMIRIEALKKVMAAETFDNAWFAQAGALLGIDPAQLERPGWDKGQWKAEWGEIENIVDEGVEIVVWHRNDGGPSMADKNAVPNPIKLVKFGLLAELALAFTALGQLTYVSVGYPEDKWRSVVVYLNGNRVSEVIEADSLMGLVRVTAREKGKLKMDGGEVKSKVLMGTVRLEVEKNQQAFF